MKVARVLGLLVAALAALAVLSSPSPVHADHSDGEIIGFAFRLNTLLKDVVDEHAKSSEFGLSLALSVRPPLSSRSRSDPRARPVPFPQPALAKDDDRNVQDEEEVEGRSLEEEDRP